MKPELTTPTTTAPDLWTPKRRFLTAIRADGIPDRVPCAPDFSNYIPCKRTGLPFWDIYFFQVIPLWQAYLNAADYYGTEAWIASGFCPPYLYAASPVERSESYHRHPADQALIQRLRIRTPDGDLTQETVCPIADPPTLTEKPLKNLERDLPLWLKWLMPMPTGIDRQKVAEVRAACERRNQAFGVAIGYPGFHAWSYLLEDGLMQLSCADMDGSPLLDAWHERDMAVSIRQTELALELKPDYILFGGSGTLTLASPDLVRRFVIPTIKKQTALTKAAGVPSMLHSCGKSSIFVDMLAEETDLDSVNPLEIPPMGDVDLAATKRRWGHRLGLMGNLHTTGVMLHGTPAEVRAAAIQALRDAGTGGGFILSTGDQCGRETPEENLFTLVEAAKEFGVYDQATGLLPNLPVDSTPSAN